MIRIGYLQLIEASLHMVFIKYKEKNSKFIVEKPADTT